MQILTIAVALVHAGWVAGEDWSYSKVLGRGSTLQWKYDDVAIEMKVSGIAV